MTLEFPLALLAIPVVLGAAVFSFRRADRVAQVLCKANALWASPTRIGRSSNRGRVGLRGLCLLVGSLFVVAALARPQWGTEEEVVFDQAREVVLALDLSRSMVAADVSPTRLDRSKLLIESLLDELKGERVGLVVFAGTAFLQSPLSSDYEVLRDLLPELTPSYLPQGGTDYEAMLATALRSFHDADGKGDRFLVVLSDGEAHGEGFRRLVPTLKAKGVRVLGLGVGTQDGDVIPDGNGGLVKDAQGAVVLSRLESGTLRELATETGGTYRDAAGWVDIHELVEATVAKGFEGEFVEGSDLRRQDRFQWSLAPGILLLLFAFWWELPAQPSARTVRKREGGRAGWSRKAVPLVGLLLAVAMGPVTARAGDEPMRVAEPNPLEELVAELAGQQVRVAKDYAQLAEATIAYASSQPSLTASSREGVVGDALLGVAFGEEEDPFAADWDNLRARLEAAREPPVPPSSPESSSAEPDSPQSEAIAGAGLPGVGRRRIPRPVGPGRSIGARGVGRFCVGGFGSPKRGLLGRGGRVRSAVVIKGVFCRFFERRIRRIRTEPGRSAERGNPGARPRTGDERWRRVHCLKEPARTRDERVPSGRARRFARARFARRWSWSVGGTAGAIRAGSCRGECRCGFERRRRAVAG